VEHASKVLDCRDLSQAHRAVVDGLWLDDNLPLINRAMSLYGRVLYLKLWGQ
jgi:hypothetical protein